MLSNDPYQDLYPPNKGTLFEGEPGLCDSAKLFLEVASSLLEYLKIEIAPVLEKKDDTGKPKAPPSTTEVNQALTVVNTVLVQLQHKYFEAKRLAPKSCQVQAESSSKHTCLPQIHEKIYDEMMRHTLPIAGPIFQVPGSLSVIPDPTPVVRKQFVPLFMGDDD